jgi:hypothetical protein
MSKTEEEKHINSIMGKIGELSNEIIKLQQENEKLKNEMKDNTNFIHSYEINKFLCPVCKSDLMFIRFSLSDNENERLLYIYFVCTGDNSNISIRKQHHIRYDLNFGTSSTTTEFSVIKDAYNN